jgi:phosphoenolpyruvate carboxylase
MSTPLDRDIAWLCERLDEVETSVSQHDLKHLRTIVDTMLESGRPDASLAELPLEQIRSVLKFLTIRFHLRNKAEQVHIARVNRERERTASPHTPRPESIAEAIVLLARRGDSVQALSEALASLDIEPTLTAHPTESRRRSVVQKQRRVGDLLDVHNSSAATPAERADAESAVRQTLSLLLATDEVRSRRLEVIDEVRNGINYLAGPIWDAIPSLYRDLERSIRAQFDTSIDLPTVLRFRSWIGGDRDGNPNVTAKLTRTALAEMREAAIARHRVTLERLRHDFSVSDRRVAVSPELSASIQRDDESQPLDPFLVRHLRHEPLRVKIRHMQDRLGRVDYSANRFMNDLEVLADALKHADLDEVASNGLLHEAMIQARTFGFHLAALDIRQHSRIHAAAVGEMFHRAGVTSDYGALDESARLEILRNELRSSRPLLAPQARLELSDDARSLCETLEVIADAVRSDPASIGSYIVSMAHQASDILEVLILLREVGLWSIADGIVTCPINVVPLFETVDDLDGADAVMAALINEPVYRAHLVARSDFQEIMLGYSDSNKDGGYWTANWRLFDGQDRLARTLRDAQISFRFFHGRGGTIARGGGRAHRAILASPRSSANGRIRFTEQGEVISFRYASPALAHRHLEQIVNAMLQTTSHVVHADSIDPTVAEDMNALAESSRTLYRQLIDDPGFWPWFIRSSPVLHIGELPIASRPVARSGSALDFENLRAIPWVFSWTQMRANVPGWYGLGTAFDEVVMGSEARIESFRKAYRDEGCVRSFIDNAQQEMARSRLAVARWYAGEDGAWIHRLLANEFERAERVILTLTGQAALLDNNPVIQESIRARNPDTDVINALQVELLRRWHDVDEDEQAELHAVLLLSVNALAAAMQSTG